MAWPAMGAEWKIDKRKDAVDLSVTGNFTHGSLQRFIFRKSQCGRVIHTFSAFTMPTEPVDFDKMTGKTFTIQFNGEKIGARLEGAYKAMLGHLLYFNLGGYGKDVLLKHLKKDEKITIEFIDGEGYKAADYFDVPSNEWSIDGIAEAFDDAYQVCSR